MHAVVLGRLAYRPERLKERQKTILLFGKGGMWISKGAVGWRLVVVVVVVVSRHGVSQHGVSQM